MGIARITALLAVTALLLALPAMVLAQAQPPRPPVFGGTVTTDGVVASDGTVVTAWIDGNRVASAMVSGGGYAFAIPQPPGESYAGKTITFKIGDTTASETGIWQSDGGGQLNLTSASEYTDVVRVGLFGTVSAIPAGTFILDSGEIVAVDQNTKYVVQGVDAAGLGDIAVGDRLAIVAVKFPDGRFLAREVAVTYQDPVRNSHEVGLVTAIDGDLVTLIDSRGNTFTVQLPPGSTAAVGEFLTAVSSTDPVTGAPSVYDVATVDVVLDRLSKDIERAVGAAQKRLKRLLGENGDQHLTGLMNALKQASGQARDALEAALNASQSHLDLVFSRWGVEGPFVKVKGFVTAITTDSVTIATSRDVAVTLDITESTKLEGPIAVGAFVKAKYNLDLVASKVETESDEVTFRGTVAATTPMGLSLYDGTYIVVDGNTDTEGALAIGVRVKVDALPVSGGFVALEIKVEDEEEEQELKESKLKGTVTALSETSLELDRLVTVLITPDVEIADGLALNSRVKVKVVQQDGVYVALEIEVKALENEKDEKSDLEFKGLITGISGESIEVDGFGPIKLTGNTVTIGIPALGAEVEVKAQIQSDGTIVATRIKVEDELKVKGVVGSFTPTQVVLDYGSTFVIDGDTKTRGALAIGAKVEIEAKLQPDGSRVAKRVKVESKFELEGAVANVTDAQLLLEDGSSFVITEETKTRGNLRAGVKVEVKARVLPNGTVVATRIKAEKIDKRQGEEEPEKGKLEFEGRVASFTSDALVLKDGSIFALTKDTRTEGFLAVGAEVEVNARLSPDGSTLVATKIEVEEEEREKAQAKVEEEREKAQAEAEEEREKAQTEGKDSSDADKDSTGSGPSGG